METTVTKIRTKHGQWGRPVAITTDHLAALIAAPTAGPASRSQRDRLPYIIFSALFASQGVHVFRQPTGLMLLSAMLPADSLDASVLRRRVAALPQTLMAFTDDSRRTLRIVARCQSADRLLPTDSIAYLSFLTLAQQQAARYYEAMCDCRIQRCEQTLTAGCRLCSDPLVYHNAEATALTVGTDVDALRQNYPLARTTRDGLCVNEPDWRDVERQRNEYYACVDRAWSDVDVIDDDPLFGEQLVTRLAELCHKAGLPEESCVRRTGSYSRWHLDEPAVRRIFRTVYRRTPTGRPWSAMSEKERIARKVRDFFDRRYELRFNVLKQAEEFRPRGVDYHPWQSLTERDINRIGQEQMVDSGAAWPIDIKQYAQSSLTPDYNPVHEFLAGCGTWDGRHDYIGQLADRVPTSNPHWRRLFHRWFLGMVAQWMGRSRDYGNAVVPLLVGPQGCRKSTFCKLILPHALREYYIDDIKLDNAEQVERMLCRMALVNIDEYNAKSDREQAKIKRLLTERDVQVRRMRSDQYRLLQRMASFVATTNERQPLSDPTGSRRYLCAEVVGTIDTVTPLNYQQLYAQALDELQQGEPYWMSPEEEQLMIDHNSRFVRATTTELLLESYYQPASREKAHFMRAVDILADLQQRVLGKDRPNMQQLIRALKTLHYQYGAIGGVHGWYARRLQSRSES